MQNTRLLQLSHMKRKKRESKPSITLTKYFYSCFYLPLEFDDIKRDKDIKKSRGYIYVTES